MISKNSNNIEWFNSPIENFNVSSIKEQSYNFNTNSNPSAFLTSENLKIKNVKDI